MGLRSKFKTLAPTVDDAKANPLGAQAAQGAAAPKTLGTTGSADIGQPSAPNTPSAGGQGKTPGAATSSGSFTNLSKYMEANKAGTQGMSSALQNKIGEKQAAATKELNTQKEEFNKGIGQATGGRIATTGGAEGAISSIGTLAPPTAPVVEVVPPRETPRTVGPVTKPKVGFLDTSPSTSEFTKGYDSIGHPILQDNTVRPVLTQQQIEEKLTKTTPTHVPTTAEQEAIAKAGLDQKYTGPEGLKNLGALQAQGKQLGQIAADTRTSKGQSGLLASYVGGAGQGVGASSLDAMLIGSNKDALRKLAEAGVKGRAFGAGLSAEQVATAEQVGKEKFATTQAAEDLKTKLGGATAGLQSEIDKQVKDINAANDSIEISKSNPSEARNNMQKLLLGEGMSPQQVALTLDNIDWTNADTGLLKKTFEDATERNLSPEALAKKKALLRLAGKETELSKVGEYAKLGGPAISSDMATQLANTMPTVYEDLKIPAQPFDKAGLADAGNGLNIYEHIQAHNPDFMKGIQRGDPDEMRMTDSLTTDAQKKTARDMANRWLPDEINSRNYTLYYYEKLANMAKTNAEKYGVPAKKKAAAQATLNKVLGTYATHK